MAVQSRIAAVTGANKGIGLAIGTQALHSPVASNTSKVYSP